MPKKFIYDEVAVGEGLGFADYTLATGTVQKFAEAIEDFHPWYLKNSPFGYKIAHPTTASIYCMSVFLKYYIFPEGGIHAKQRWKFLRPVPHGATIRTYGKIVDKYVKKGKRYVVVEMRSEDKESGQPFLEGQSTMMLPEGTGA